MVWSARKQAEAMIGQLIDWRRHIHRHPELSFQEVETARFITAVLSDVPGMQVVQGVGYATAVVGTLTSGNGPIIAIRADIDALPIQEANNCDYVSQNKGVMHACGHDAHMAIALGTAHLLSERMQRGEITGTVKFLFQPAEEKANEQGETGAPHMIEAGVLADVEQVIALHMSPEDKLGNVKIHDGYSMANVDVFHAVVRGTGGHGAYPHLGTDPVWMLGPLFQAIHGIVARRVSPLEAAVISIGRIQGGVASNVIPSEVTMDGTIRSYQPDVREQVHGKLEKAFSVVNALGGDYQMTITPEDPALHNDPKVNQQFRRVFQDLYPDFCICEQPFGLGGEDFAHMTQVVSGAMFFLGCGLEDGDRQELHTPTFDIDERVLPVGVAVFSEVLSRYLS